MKISKQMKEYLENTIKQLKDELTASSWQLLEIIWHCGNTDQQEGITTADKGVVLNRLQQAEGGHMPDANAIRKRIQRANTALKLLKGSEQQPVLQIKSTKTALRIEWSKLAVEQQQQQEQKQILGKSSANELDKTVSETFKPAFQIPVYQVFISHAWDEDQAIEDILDEFVEQLKSACDNLPEKWRNRFQIKIWFDRDDIRGTQLTRKQLEQACNDSNFALFITSSKWCRSKECRFEASHFIKREPQAFLTIQLTGSYEDLDEKYRQIPVYPSCKSKKYRNLFDLWKDENLGDDKNKLVACIIDDICDYLDKNTETKVTNGYPSQDIHKKLKLEQDIAENKAIPPHIIKEGDDQDNANSIPAIETLCKWACDKKPKKRITTILGGFGTGKTVTVQMFAKVLHKKPIKDKAPTPIYLDFRRLLDKAEHGKPMDIKLGELILSTLDSETQLKLGPIQIIDLLRKNNFVVIFDGLDEIGNRIGRDNAIKLYRDLIDLIPSEVQRAEAESKVVNLKSCRTRLIITCRTHFFRDLREQKSFFARAHRSVILENNIYYMAPLSLEKIQELFKLNLGEKKGKQTFALIRTIHDLPGLASRPIMARFISEIAGKLIDRHQQGLPINIATIYQNLFYQSLERDVEKQPLLNNQDRQHILTRLACNLQNSGKQSLPADELEEWFDGFASQHDGIDAIFKAGQANTRNLLHTELENVSFLVRDSSDRFRFAHTSYFEYFLATVLVKALQDEDIASLSQLTSHSISSETGDFIHAIAENNQQQPDLAKKLQLLLASQAPASVRKFCLELHLTTTYNLNAANLSGLDLRGISIGTSSATTLWHGVNLQGTMLNRLNAQRITFSQCDFSLTILANATFEQCTFNNCSDIPLRLISARGLGTELPDSWQGQIGGCGYRWQDVTPGTKLDFPVVESYQTIAYSPDGNMLVTGGSSNTARLWDSKTGREVLQLPGHTDLVTSAAFNHDSTQVITASLDKTVRIWDAHSGTEVLLIKGHTDAVNNAAFNHDGTQVITASDDQTVRIWDAHSGKQLLLLDGHTNWVNSAAFNRDGTQAITASFDKAARIWDAHSGKQLLLLDGHTDWVNSATFNHDGTQVITASLDKTVRIWDAHSGTQLLLLDGHTDSVNSAAFNHDSTQVITVSRDKTVRIWDAHTGTQLLILKGHTHWVNSAAFNHDGTQVVTAGDDKTVHIWDAHNCTEVLLIKGHTRSNVTSAAFNHDGTQAIIASRDKTVRIWDAHSGTQLLLDGHTDWVNSAAFNHDGTQVITASFDGTVRIWDAHSGTQLLLLYEHTDWVRSATFNHNGTQAITAGDNKTVRIWDTHSGKQLLLLDGHTDDVNSAVFNHDGTQVITASDDKTVRIWDAHSGTQLLLIKEHTDWVRSAAFNHDGTQVITASLDKTVRIWDAHSGTQLLLLDGHTSWVRSAAFNHDGTQAITTSFDKTARIWDAHSGTQLLLLDGHTNEVNSAAFNHDGTQVITASADGSSKIWDAKTAKLLASHHIFADAWAQLDGNNKLINSGGKLWKYLN